jgi:hypothetical protein
MFGKENYNPPEHQEQLHEQSNKKNVEPMVISI